MYALRTRGLGDAPSLLACFNPAGGAVSPECLASWASLFQPSIPTVAAPPVPTAAQLASPWQGSDAVQAAQSQMVTQQLQGQQLLDAAGVTQTPSSQVLGATYQAGQTVGDVVTAALPWATIALVGAGALLLILLIGKVR